ncbi:MAG: DUF3775 domain-containing protein [Gammaproteobacteria bacterium]|nr:DUF3775 domain-containing protein [Gammaproteobacteria bacterium]
MLQINPEAVCQLITLARDFQTQDVQEINEEQIELNEDIVSNVSDNDESNHTQSEIKSMIEDLEPDQQVNLTALMWLGRGDFSTDEWDKALQEAGDSWNDRSADYLIGTPLVADYLEEGLNLLGYSCE